MDLFFECKVCHREVEWEVEWALEAAPDAAPPRCGTCKVGVEPAAVERLSSAIAALAQVMAEVRTTFRFEVLLESDDLPAPHGFDALYTLPEDAEEAPE